MHACPKNIYIHACIHFNTQTYKHIHLFIPMCLCMCVLCIYTWVFWWVARWVTAPCGCVNKRIHIHVLFLAHACARAVFLCHTIILLRLPHLHAPKWVLCVYVFACRCVYSCVCVVLMNVCMCEREYVCVGVGVASVCAHACVVVRLQQICLYMREYQIYLHMHECTHTDTHTLSHTHTHTGVHGQSWLQS